VVSPAKTGWLGARKYVPVSYRASASTSVASFVCLNARLSAM